MSIPKLLRAIAGGTQAQENKHDIILNAAADQIDEAAAFLDRLAQRIDAWHRHSQMPTLPSSAADCRAMAAKLRSPTELFSPDGSRPFDNP